jgi:hypothetical protein
MVIAVIVTGALIFIVALIFKYWLKIKLGFGMSGLVLILLPHSIGFIRPYDSGTFIYMGIAALVGVFLLVVDVARQKK